MDDKKLILVVDDDPDLVEAISMKLASENYRVAKAYDGIQAWDRIREERPHLIILDVMMPNKNGYQVCKELKNDPQYKNITVVLRDADAPAAMERLHRRFFEGEDASAGRGALAIA